MIWDKSKQRKMVYCRDFFTAFVFLCVCISSSALAASGMFPKMPPAPKACLVEITKDTENAKMTAWALQGMLNQQSAEVYLINNPWDVEPLEHCGKPFEKLQKVSGIDAGLRTLFQKNQARVKKMFVYDPDQDWTWYLALMSAAQQEGIPVTESVRNELTSEFGWKGGVEDFRNRWANRIEAYDWAITNLMPNCTKQVVFATGNRRLDPKAERIGNPNTDYAVASKGFVFWLDFEKERTEVDKIFRTPSYGVGTSLMGYASTGDLANRVANPHGFGYVCDELYANGSFWSSFPNKTYTQRPGKIVALEPGKIYTSIMWSDGDNLEFDQNPLYKFWNDPARGKVPVATALSPALQELNSPLLDWYYSNMTENDELMAGPTGFQFIYIRDFNSDLFPAWCELNRTWCAGAGFRTARIWLAPNPSAKYTAYMKTCGLDGVIGEGWSIEAGLPPKLGDPHGAANEAEVFNQLAAIKPNEKKPLFVNLTCIVGGFYQGGRGYSAIKRQIDRLEKAYPGRFVFLLPKDQFATIRANYNTNTPQIEGRPHASERLTPLSSGDGAFTIVERDGKNYWLLPKRSPPNYFYLDADDHFLVQSKETLEIELEYLNSGAGEVILQYDSTDSGLPYAGTYKLCPSSIRCTNNGQWQTARFSVSDARFAGRQNNGADFRFYNGGDDLLIRAVRVRRMGK
jgi:hypothetical protein